MCVCLRRVKLGAKVLKHSPAIGSTRLKSQFELLKDNYVDFHPADRRTNSRVRGFEVRIIRGRTYRNKEGGSF